MKWLIFKGEVNVFIGQDLVENVSYYKDLGITFSTNLKWEAHIASKITDESKAFLLLETHCILEYSSKVELSLHIRGVLSFLLYGSQISKIMTMPRKMELFPKKHALVG